MSKLYRQLFIILLSMLTCMPIKYVQTGGKFERQLTSPFYPYNSYPIVETSESNETNIEEEISQNLKFFSDLNNEISVEGHESTWTTGEIVIHYKYFFQKYDVTTSDGYILELHRIPPKTGQNVVKKNFPVLIPHGVGGSSADWVLAGPGSSLAMQLNDEGYDVWLANYRGNTYSRRHLKLNTTDQAFWNFTLHELGTIDLPAIINIVLNVTNKKQLHYIGYSMSTCIFYIMASTMTDYQQYIRSQISLAPMSRLGHSTSALTKLAIFNGFLDILAQTTANGEFNSDESYIRKILQKYCKKSNSANQKLCLKFIIFSIFGSNKETFNTNILLNIVGHYPSSTSSKVVAHLVQLIKRDKFAQYSYGQDKNKNVYGNNEPPLYNLEAIKVPITLMYGSNDKLVQPKDAVRLLVSLPKIMDFIKVNDPKFNHIDFLWNRNVKVQINDIVVATFNETDKLTWSYKVGGLLGNSNRVGSSAGAPDRPLAPAPSSAPAPRPAPATRPAPETRPAPAPRPVQILQQVPAPRPVQAQQPAPAPQLASSWAPATVSLPAPPPVASPALQTAQVTRPALAPRPVQALQPPPAPQLASSWAPVPVSLPAPPLVSSPAFPPVTSPALPPVSSSALRQAPLERLVWPLVPHYESVPEDRPRKNRFYD